MRIPLASVLLPGNGSSSSTSATARLPCLTAHEALELAAREERQPARLIGLPDLPARPRPGQSQLEPGQVGAGVLQRLADRAALLGRQVTGCGQEHEHAGGAAAYLACQRRISLLH